MHKGMMKQELGYDYTITADDQKRFTGTAWQSGHMRGRAKQDAIMIVVDDIRTGINTSGFCFWDIIILNADRKAHTILWAMTMDPTDEANYFVLASLVKMSPFVKDMVNVTISDIGLQVTVIDSVFPNVNLRAACVWQIIVIDFPKNLKNIYDYDACKKYVDSKLVHNTVCKEQWNDYLAHACRKWPTAAKHLHDMAAYRER